MMKVYLGACDVTLSPFTIAEVRMLVLVYGEWRLEGKRLKSNACAFLPPPLLQSTPGVK